jgi:hypothetical protein
VTVLINTLLHDAAKCTRVEFLDKVSDVEAIRASRTNVIGDGLSFYICSQFDYSYFRHLKLAISAGDYTGLDGAHNVKHFGLDLPVKIVEWFDRNDIDLIYRQVICWMASLYAFGGDFRGYIEEEIYQPLLEEVLRVYNEHYPVKLISQIPQMYQPWDTELAVSTYQDACKAYYGSAPPTHLSLPNVLLLPGEPIDGNRHRIEVRRFYFTEQDWKRVIVNGVVDNMWRAESSKEYWTKWKHQYTISNTGAKCRYSLFDNKQAKGFVYIIQQLGTRLHKIGFTGNSNINKRRGELQTGNPNELIVAGSFPCSGVQAETALHGIFRLKRKTGEWFDLSETDVSNILDEVWRVDNSVF